eukprot:scaffold130253_cov102-Phaeocystis_antarctica.AAC.1
MRAHGMTLAVVEVADRLVIKVIHAQALCRLRPPVWTVVGLHDGNEIRRRIWVTPADLGDAVDLTASDAPEPR